MSNIISLSAGLLLTNSRHELLMIHETDGWGIPSGKVEAKDFLPSRAILREFAEETKISLLGPIAIAGLTIILRPDRLSIGILYRATQQTSQTEFTTIPQALALISERKIREAEYNLPAILGWITNSFVISLRRERG